MTSSPSMKNSIPLHEYLLMRLEQLRVRTVQGVPGDYNLLLLNRILERRANRAESPEWVGNANELNAAYSADGLARVLGPKRPSVIVTTMGVGELSAANGIAGSYAERLPVVHIVGTPATTAQRAGLLLHHTLGDHNFSEFGDMARYITASQVDFANLKREGRLEEGMGEDAARELDRVLEVCVRRSQPVYIALPSDLVDFPLPASCRSRLSDRPLQLAAPSNDTLPERSALDQMVYHVRGCASPVILVDLGALRHDVMQETRQLVEKSGLPVFVTPMSKTVIDESHDQFGGLYVGVFTSPEVKKVVEDKADAIIVIGPAPTDSNTGAFTWNIQRSLMLELRNDKASIGHASWEGVGMKHLLPKLADALAVDRERRLKHTQELLEPIRASPTYKNTLLTNEQELSTLSAEQVDSLGGKEAVTRDTITHAYLWPRVAQFLQPGDRVIGETGTSSFGLLGVRFPTQAQYHTQGMGWGSIGWATPATLGAALGMRQLAAEGDDSAKQGRTILFTGEGSLQLTVQEIATVIRQGLTPLIFLINNEGYETERQITGADAYYNDVAVLNYAALLDFLSPPKSYTRPSTKSHARDPSQLKTAYHAVHTKAELDALLKNEEFNKADKVTVVEICVPSGDAPMLLRRAAQMTAKINSC